MSGVDAAFQELATVVLVAGGIALLFWRLRQPLVLGYLLAGLVLSPFTPGPWLRGAATLKFLGDMGIVFLFFALGLEFSLRKLRRVGMAAFLATALEVAAMLALGYVLGRTFGWSPLESVFLGAILSITSTTIFLKIATQGGYLGRPWAHLVIGISLVEDIVGILMLTALSGLAQTGGFDPSQLGALTLRLVLFLGVFVILGLLILPRLTDWLVRVPPEEVLVFTGVGLGFGSALFASSLGLSPGLGAFFAGALMAESKHVHRLVSRIVPLRDLFTGIFFVWVGSTLDPAVLLDHWAFIALLTVGVIIGKTVGVSAGAFLGGRPTLDSFRAGVGMAQIGEFSFVIAALGVTVGTVRSEIFAVAVGVCALSTLVNPPLIRRADRIAGFLHRLLPAGVAAYLASYSSWTARLGRAGRARPEWHEGRRALLRAGLYGVAALGMFAGTAALRDEVDAFLLGWAPSWSGITVSLGWVLVTVATTPLAFACAVQTHTSVARFARAAVPDRLQAEAQTTTEVLLRRTFGAIAVLVGSGLFLLVALPIVRSPWLVLGVGVGVATAAVVLGRGLTRFHAEVERTIDGLRGELQEHREDALELVEGSHAWGAAHHMVTLGPAGGSGRTIAELRIRELTGATVVAIVRGRENNVSPGPAFRFAEGDRVALLGDPVALARAEEILLGRELGVEGGATEILVGEGSALIGRTLASVDFETATGARVLATRRGEALLASSESIARGDVVVVAGTTEEVQRARAIAGPAVEPAWM